MEQEPILSKAWSPVPSAFFGGYVGLMAALAHEVYNLLLGRFNDIDPFIELLSKTAVANLGGAMLFATVAWVHNRLVPDWSLHRGLEGMTSRCRASSRSISTMRRAG